MSLVVLLFFFFNYEAAGEKRHVQNQTQTCLEYSQPAILGRQQLTKDMRKARRQRAPTYCFPSSFQIIMTSMTSWLVPSNEDFRTAATLNS